MIFTLVVLNSCSFEDMELDNSELFKQLVSETNQKPRDIQGGGFTWQGYNVWLRFPINETNFLSEYEIVDCKSYDFKVHIRGTDWNKVRRKNSNFVDFDPPWKPFEDGDYKCYEFINDKDSAAGNFVVLNEANKYVYFRAKWP